MNLNAMLKGLRLWRAGNVICQGSVSLLLMMLISGQAQASLILDQNRVVLSANEGGMGVVKVDNPTDRDYLIQSWITTDNNGVQEALFVQPPLVKIKAHQKVALHIEAIDSSLAEQPQEQLYRLNVKEIPKVEEKSGSQLILVMLTKVKILYRPAAVSPEMGNQYTKLTWKKVAGKLQVYNPTPYYVTFSKVWEGNDTAHALDADMVGPHSTMLIKGYHGASDINYRIINDYGDISKPVHVKL
ncbi:molecular chaperone [Pantoea alhagi]|uniref:fimbrial biogenesis chaperone n=1 Tax=Pantoea alhagi TaxID=1891675 RepID=UPI00202B8F45|nr:molecular chaperone [Pantoea alhagi]URQ59582.1 molecular chaperone [Pantoea alhagi]